MSITDDTDVMVDIGPVHKPARPSRRHAGCWSGSGSRTRRAPTPGTCPAVSGWGCLRPFRHWGRVAVARALALEPGPLLFGEPTSALDPELVGEVLDVVKDRARQGTTMIVVTHEIGFAREAADTVVLMDDGRIVEQGPPHDVLDRPRHERTRALLSKGL